MKKKTLKLDEGLRFDGAISPIEVILRNLNREYGLVFLEVLDGEPVYELLDGKRKIELRDGIKIAAIPPERPLRTALCYEVPDGCSVEVRKYAHSSHP